MEGMIPSADAMDRIETNWEESNVGRALQMDRSDWKGRGIE